MTDGSGEKLQIIMLIIRINRVFSGFYNQLKHIKYMEGILCLMQKK